MSMQLARGSLAAVFSAACLAVFASHVGAAEPGAATPKSVSSPQAYGEPYELPGERLVFTNWFYVRPGGLAWVDDQGRGVTVAGNEGPWGAHFRRADSPFGIRLVRNRLNAWGRSSRANSLGKPRG